MIQIYDFTLILMNGERELKEKENEEYIWRNTGNKGIQKRIEIQRGKSKKYKQYQPIIYIYKYFLIMMSKISRHLDCIESLK